jgi:hypothetical protein
LIAALLSFYDEPPKFMRELVESLRLIDCRQLVAMDGAYALYPNAEPSSPEKCRKALRQACYQNGVKLTWDEPDAPWETEAAKRTELFRLAETVTMEDDWYCRIDGDERFIQAPKDLPETLDGLKARAATAELIEPDGSWQSLRVFYRAERGIQVVGNHYTYELPDGTRLYGDHNDDRVVPAAYTPCLIEHRNLRRSKARRDAGLGFYRVRDAEAPERHDCAFCGTSTPMSIPYGWAVNHGGHIKGLRTGCCEDCYPQRSEESIAQAAELGQDARHLFPGARVSVFR